MIKYFNLNHLFKEKKQDHFINFKTIFPERVFQSLIRLHTPRQNKKEIPGTAVDTQHSRDSNTQKLLLKLKTVSN